MINRQFLSQCIFFCFIAYFNSIEAAPISWVAQSPNSNMDDPSNWSANSVPGSSDTAIFNSHIVGISANLVENTAPFSVSVFNFPFNASIFHFNFNNQSLTFNGSGLTGSNTNPSITVTNTNNSSFPGDLISFVGGSGNSGGAIITTSNSGTLTGSQSGTSIGAINSNLHSSGTFIIGNSGAITASNIGNDHATGTGNNGAGNTGASQLRFDQSFNAGSYVDISVSSSGTFSGNNSSQGDAVAIVNGAQLISSDAFFAGDNFSCGIQNIGNDSSIGVGLSNIGQINAAQMLLQNTATVGKNCTITVSNTANNSSQTTSSSDYIGYLNDQQLFVGNSFQAGDNFTLTVNNTGVDTSSGHGGHQVAVINSNSGTTGDQILFQHGGLLGNHATISVANSGTYSGSNTSGGSNIAGMNHGQIAVGDFTTPGTYQFIAGDYFNLNISTSGIDTCHGTGGDAVGGVSTDQVAFYTPAALGNHANITITSSGNFSGDASSTYVNVGSMGGRQLACESNFSAGDDFTLNISSSGNNTGTGVGGYFIGDIITGQQAAFQENLIIGNSASITILNSGSNSSNTTNNNQVGSMMGYGKQLLAKSLFTIGDDAYLEIRNSGFDNSTGSGGNFVGFMNNNTVDNSGSQIHLDHGGTIGDRATITLSNAGTYQGSNMTSGNLIAVLGGQQLHSADSFHVGSDFALAISNSGTDNTLGQSGNSIGTISGSQVQFDSDFLIGSNASVAISNSGTNNDTTGTSNNIGVINGSQLVVSGGFTAGENLTLSASNTSANKGDSSNFVGHLTGSQLFFAGDCTLNNGSIISAFNSGDTSVSQIMFGQGFNVASGSVTIQAINQGSLGSFGIDIQGNNAGGNARITLENSSLNIETTLSTFDIGGLNGDSLSIVQSQPQLIINTDASVQSEFSGVIQDYPSISSVLMKTGAGAQTLSGINTYTGPTSIQKGILSINGSIIGDVTVSSGGTLKGTGTVGGAAIIENGGTLSPGNSVGTINLNTLFLNPAATTVIEIAPTASSSVNVAGSAVVDGALQIVQDQGVYPRQGSYQILTAGSLSGVFSSINTLPGFTFNFAYLGNSIYLNYYLAIPTKGLTGNSLTVANYLNQYAPSSYEFMCLTALSGNTLNQALESVSPSRNAFGAYITEQVGFSLSNLLTAHIDKDRVAREESSKQSFIAALLVDASDRVVKNKEQRSEDKFSLWISGFGEFAHQTAQSQNPSFNFNSEAVVAGCDYHMHKKAVAGGALGYAHTHFYDQDDAGHGNINYYFVSAYGNTSIDHFYISPAIWGVFNQNSNTRRIAYPGVSEVAKAHIFAWQMIPHLEVGYEFKYGWGEFRPFTSADWAISWQRAYTEEGVSPFNASQKANNSSMVRSETGLKFCEKWEKKWGVFFLKEKLAYVFEKPFGVGTVNAAFTGIPTAFTVTAVDHNLNLAAIGLDFLAAFGKKQSWLLDFSYNGEFGVSYWSNDLTLTLTKHF